MNDVDGNDKFKDVNEVEEDILKLLLTNMSS